MNSTIAVLAGDGIGPEIVSQAVRVLNKVRPDLTLKYAAIGGAGYDAAGDPLPAATLELAQQADAVLLGAVGGPQYDTLPRDQRPERGLLRIRKALELFANLRPAILYPELVSASTLKPEVVAGLDILIVRELTGDIYFGEPRGVSTKANGVREGVNTMRYSEDEIRRIAKVAFNIAMGRNKRVCSVDKANVLETTELWRQVVTETAKGYPEISLTHMYVDNAAMQLVRDPKQFDVLLTGNIFGDILSDEAAMLTGSIGMLPSASLSSRLNKHALPMGLYEPSHGSAPEIAGKNIANPLATILSVVMMLRYSLGDKENAQRIENAIKIALEKGARTADIATAGEIKLSCSQMGDCVLEAL